MVINKYYTFSKTLVVRNPAYQVGECLNKNTAELIREKMSSVYFRNALLLGSYAFFTQLQRYVQGEDLSDKKRKRIESTFIKYLSRMSTRCTPFGMFSTVATQNMDDIGSGEGEENSRDLKIRLDMALLEGIAKEASRRYPEYLTYTVNNSMITQGEQGYTYTRYTTVKGKRIHEFTSLDANAYIELLLAEKGKWMPLQEIVDAFLTMDASCPEESIREFVNELIHNRVLVNDLELHVTGGPYQSTVASTLRRILAKTSSSDTFLQDMLRVIAVTQALTAEDDLACIREEIVTVLNRHGISFNEKNVFHASAYRRKGITPAVNQQVISDVMKGINILCYFSLKKENEHLTNFKKAFKDIYGDALIPLSLVLDTKRGLGYPINESKIDAGNSLLQELTLGQKSSKDWTTYKFHTHNHRFWFKKYLECMQTKATEIVLQDEDIAAFQSHAHLMPNTFSCSFSLHEGIPGQMNGIPRSYTIKYNGSGGRSALNFLARFSTDSAAVRDLCQEIVAAEKNRVREEELIAEICHIPEPRIGDILSHDRFWEYEIPYLVNTSVAAEQSVHVEDLLIGVHQDRVKLYSVENGKIIKPILSNAHNYKQSEHPIYRFLCDVQNEGKISGPYLDFGWWANEVEFFPQVRYRNLVFVPRSWTLSKHFFQDYFQGQQTREAAKESFLNIQPPIPETFVVGEGDNELYVNMRLPSHWDVLLEYISKQRKEQVIIKEFVQPAGSYSNEIILSLLKKDTHE